MDGMICADANTLLGQDVCPRSGGWSVQHELKISQLSLVSLADARVHDLGMFCITFASSERNAVGGK
jgi:hypothetical protein